MTEAEKRFPILIGFRYDRPKPTIPWSVIAPHEQQARRNHSQSLEMLAERGGLGWCETLAVLTDRSWYDLTNVEKASAEQAVRDILREKEAE